MIQIFRRLVAPVVTLGLWLILYYAGVPQTLAANALDLLFHLRGKVRPDPSVIIIGIDQATIDAFNGWPLPRTIHADLLSRLPAAKAVGFDIIFSEPKDEDELLNNAFGSGAPVTLSVIPAMGDNSLWPVPTFTKNRNIGHIVTHLGTNGIVRRVESCRAGVPTLAKAMLVTGESGTGCSGKPETLLLNFYGPEQSFLYLSYLDVLLGKIDAEFFKDKYVLVGAWAAALSDMHITPFSTGQPTPGIEVQATILSNYLEGSFLREIKPWGWVLTLLLLSTGFLIWPHLPEYQNLIGNLLVLVFLGGLCIALFRENVYVNIVPAALLLFLAYMIYLVLLGISTTRRILAELRSLFNRLQQALKTTYVQVPEGFNDSLIATGKDCKPFGKETGHYLSQLQRGISLLFLQNRFISHLLKEAVPPLILWHRQSGETVLASSMFNNLWNGYDDTSDLPTLSRFFELLVGAESKGKDSAENILTPSDITEKMVMDMKLRGRFGKRFFQVVLQPVESSEVGFAGILAVLVDVTEAREREERKGEVVDIVSHELKLPLTTILGYSEMLTVRLNGKSQDYAREIYVQTERLGTMIGRFLDIARLESGKSQMYKYPLDLLTVIEDAIAATTMAAEKKKIAIQTDTPRKVTPFVGDETMLLQALINLLDNGVKFSPERSTVTITLEERQNGFVMHVTDEGPGIPESEGSKIFSKFHRGGHTMAESGFGLGLSFVEQVIHHHSGSIQVVSKAPEGAAFRLFLPKEMLT